MICASSRSQLITEKSSAYGYRIEHRGRLAVISGDSRYNENVVRCGQGADLLVHEGAMARPELLREPYIHRIVNHHTSPQEAGRVFAQTRPTLAAFTHARQRERNGADRRRVDRGPCCETILSCPRVPQTMRPPRASRSKAGSLNICSPQSDIEPTQ
jgi:ribonuclease BN (tRNA processing enzyme)